MQKNEFWNNQNPIMMKIIRNSHSENIVVTPSIKRAQHPLYWGFVFVPSLNLGVFPSKLSSIEPECFEDLFSLKL